PFICNILFCIFLFSVCLQMILKTGILAKNKR
ncbi:sulfite transporter TauE/SafE, partial [Bifidobacteriaceae bacterium VN002]